jgi:hypothetical protein
MVQSCRIPPRPELLPGEGAGRWAGKAGVDAPFAGGSAVIAVEHATEPAEHGSLLAASFRGIRDATGEAGERE